MNEDVRDLIRLSERVLVAAWYTKEDLEEILERDLTGEQYAKIVRDWEHHGDFTRIHDVIKNWIRRTQLLPKRIDVDAATEWLTEHGFVVETDRSHLMVSARTGTVARVFLRDVGSFNLIEYDDGETLNYVDGNTSVFFYMNGTMFIEVGRKG